MLGVLDSDAAAQQRGIGAAFIGRQPLIFMLGSLVAAARDGRGRAAVLTGEAGSGKSSLCHKVAREGAVDFRVVKVSGFSFPPQPPYAGVVECVLGCLPPAPAAPEIIRAWLTILSAEAPRQADALRPLLLNTERFDDPAWLALSYSERQARIEAAVIYVLRRAAAERPILLFIDDLQWIDDASAGVIAALVRQIGDARILVLANARTGGVPASVRDADPTLITLDTFTKDETAYHFLEDNLAHGLATEEPKLRLFQLTGGNVFFLEEAVKVLQSGPLDGQLSQLTVSSKVQDLLTMRVDHLPARSKNALQAAAVLGMEMECRT